MVNRECINVCEQAAVGKSKNNNQGARGLGQRPLFYTSNTLCLFDKTLSDAQLVN